MKEQTMQKWLDSLCGKGKPAFPILSFPAVQLLGVTVSELISDSTLQAEGMRLVAERTPSAAAVSLMDLSVEAECFGAQVRFSDDEVPTVVGRLIHDEDEAEVLTVPAVGTARSGIYIDAVRRAAELITDRPVFAGMIGPFSLAARLFDVSEIMLDCYDEPDMVHTVLGKATDFLIAYARAYREAGADGILMAEPVAGLLSPALEAEFSAPYVKRIVEAVQDENFLLIYHNCGDNTPAMLDSILTTGAAAYHFGNSVDMAVMLEKMPADLPVMGNIDPAGLFRLGTPERMTEATHALLQKCAAYPNFVISSGCDIPPMSPWANIDAFFAAVEAYDGEYGKL
ncbi:MAG: uroporphyrinogen decarboxylase family protein [Clostridia bacterium]|nr:uroporphyrinogen decarboxylase family protein [Clostridia bacterium]